MRTPAPKTCAPAGRRKLLCAKALRLAVPGGRGRRAHSDGAGSDPAVRRPAAGSGPDAFAHPRPRPLGSLPDKQSVPEGCRAPLSGGGGPVRRLAGRRAVRHRRATTGRGGRGRQPGRPAPDALPEDGPCRTACLWRAECRSGVRGCPPARGFRNTKTHLAPRLHGDPQTAGQRAATSRSPPRQPRRTPRKPWSRSRAPSLDRPTLPSGRDWRKTPGHATFRRADRAVHHELPCHLPTRSIAVR